MSDQLCTGRSLTERGWQTPDGKELFKTADKHTAWCIYSIAVRLRGRVALACNTDDPMQLAP